MKNKNYFRSALIGICKTKNYSIFRNARADQNVQLEKLYGTVDLNDRPMLEVRLPTAEPEAFEMILNYIYTDKIDCKCKSHRKTSMVRHMNLEDLNSYTFS